MRALRIDCCGFQSGVSDWGGDCGVGAGVGVGVADGTYDDGGVPVGGAGVVVVADGGEGGLAGLY